MRRLFSRRRLATLGIVLLLLIGAMAAWLYSRTIGPHHEYELNVVAQADANAPDDLHVGVAVRDITPMAGTFDTWTDGNGDQSFSDASDEWHDENGNGAFDRLWLAGFDNARPASGIAQPIDARAIALRNNGVTVVLVTADMIGIVYNDVIDIRKAVDPALGLDHVLVSATHTHEVPDPVGMWSHPIPFIHFDPAYVEFVKPRIVEAIEAAVAALEPADMHCVQVEVPEEGYVRDSRKPIVIDRSLNVFRFSKRESDETIATFVNWGNHPEALGLGNTLITPDFPYWLRKGMEEGVPEPKGIEGFGAPCLYFQGTLGGLMTPLEMTVPHRDGVQTFTEDSFEKAQALGENVAILAAHAIRSDAVWTNERPTIAWGAKSVMAPMQPLFTAVVGLGLMHQGYYIGEGARSEVNLIRVGEVWMAATPGEIYPELVIGPIEALPGRDYEIEPRELPPIFDAMDGRINLMIGLANDFIGYLLPLSQWDQEASWVYDGAPQYGEWMSAGPEVGGAVHDGMIALIEEFDGGE